MYARFRRGLYRPIVALNINAPLFQTTTVKGCSSASSVCKVPIFSLDRLSGRRRRQDMNCPNDTGTDLVEDNPIGQVELCRHPTILSG